MQLCLPYEMQRNQCVTPDTIITQVCPEAPVSTQSTVGRYKHVCPTSGRMATATECHQVELIVDQLLVHPLSHWSPAPILSTSSSTRIGIAESPRTGISPPLAEMSLRALTAGVPEWNRNHARSFLRELTVNRDYPKILSSTYELGWDP